MGAGSTIRSGDPYGSGFHDTEGDGGGGGRVPESPRTRSHPPTLSRP
jgi:hypothetical protein